MHEGSAARELLRIIASAKVTQPQVRILPIWVTPNGSSPHFPQPDTAVGNLIAEVKHGNQEVLDRYIGTLLDRCARECKPREL